MPMDIQFIEDSEYLRFIKELGLPTEEYYGQNTKMIAVAKQRIDKKDEPNEVFDIFANRSMAFNIAPEINDKPMMEQAQSINITFVDTYPVDPPPNQSPTQNPHVFMVVAPYSFIDRFASPDTHAKKNRPCLSIKETFAIGGRDGNDDSGYEHYICIYPLQCIRDT